MASMEEGETPHHPILQEFPLTPAEAGRECLVMGLRQDTGVDLARYRQLTGEELMQQHATRIAHWQEAGFVRVEEGHLRLTERGALLADAIILELI